MATNITVQLAQIVAAQGIPPGHVLYLSKTEMAEIAKDLLEEYESELHQVFLSRLSTETEGE